MSNDALFSVKDLTKHFSVKKSGFFNNTKGQVKAVDGISLDIAQGETVGIVGESGCGKSTLARTIMQLVPTTAGTVLLEGRNLTAASAAEPPPPARSPPRRAPRPLNSGPYCPIMPPPLNP